MPFYKDNAQNRKLNRVGKPYGKDATKSAPKKPSNDLGKISFKSYSEVLDKVDTFGDLKKGVFDNKIKFADVTKFIKQIKPSASVYEDLSSKQQDKLMFLVEKNAAKGVTEYTKEFYDRKVKGKTWTYDTLSKLIEKDF